MSRGREMQRLKPFSVKPELRFSYYDCEAREIDFVTTIGEIYKFVTTIGEIYKLVTTITEMICKLVSSEPGPGTQPWRFGEPRELNPPPLRREKGRVAE